MKNKKKIYKSIFLLGTGVTLAHTISYNLCVNGLNMKPFEHNEYDLYRTDVSCYSKDDLTQTSKYQTKKQDDYLVIKKENPNYFDKEHIIDAGSFTDEQIDFIIQNIDNVELLVSEDYIKDIVKEDVIQRPEAYDFEYMDVNIDENDVKHYSSNDFDRFAFFYHLVLTTVIFSSEVIMYKSIENCIKPPKSKRLTKNDKKI